jgi:nitrogen fixation protein NifX
MSVRVGVASNDGKYINQHFGHAKQFMIFDLKDDGTFKFIEIRQNSPSCQGGDHSYGSLEETLGILSDVDYVMVSQIGPGASQYLLSKNIQPLMTPGFIEEELNKLGSKIYVK